MRRVPVVVAGLLVVAITALILTSEVHAGRRTRDRRGGILSRLRASIRPEPRAAPNIASNSNAQWVDRKKALAEALEGADRLVVSPVTSDDSQAAETFAVEGKQKLLDLLAVIEINEQASGYHCLCYGDHLLRFYKGESLVATISHHHGVSIRWHDERWKGDGELTAASQVAFPRWFREQGFSAFFDAREAQLAEGRRTTAQTERFLACFPPRARPLFESPEPLSSFFIAGDREQRQSEIGGRIAHAIGGGQAATVCVCRALGTLDQRDASWFMEDGLVSRALAVGRAASGAEFTAGVAEIKGDRIAELGAARLFFEQNFQAKVPKESRAELAVQLADAALEHGNDQDKPFVIRRIQGIRDPRVIDFLRKVMHGEIGNQVEQPTTWREEPGIPAGAALSLAVLGAEGIRDDLAAELPRAQNESDRAALEIGLALLGDSSQLRTSHFKLRSYHIGFAGVAAIERGKGRYGMDALVDGALNHPFRAVNDEAVKTFQRLTNQSFTEGDPPDMVRAWWKEHRDEFMESKRREGQD